MLHLLNSRFKNGNFFIALKDILGFAPNHLAFYEEAFTHRSLQKRNTFGEPVSYERLEFLGDAVLGSVVAAYLFERFPKVDEGYLTKMRSKMVSRQTLNRVGREFGLLELMRADSHQSAFGEDVCGDLFEALVGAVFEDRGYRYCERFIRRKLIDEYVDIEELEGKILSYKSHLIEWCQKEKMEIEYRDREDTGNESVKHFAAHLFIDHKLVAKARSTSKKKAEEKASKQAYFRLKDQILD